ncbi:MAG: ATP-binding cassette domain-containing protein [Coriobacteriales bacterium]|nr:ATP-binding cassette domain-containing protein [Coriobacteriales bacterium]
MDASMVAAYRALHDSQQVIARANTLDEALQECLKTILKNCEAEYGAIWYASKKDGNVLKPYFWIGASDLTSCRRKPGEGSVGRVFESQVAERYLTFAPSYDPASVSDWDGLDIKSMICVPFSSKTEDLGVIQFVNKKGDGIFTDEEADVCEMVAMLSAMALEDSFAPEDDWTPGKVILKVRDVTREFVNGDVVTKVLKGVNLDVYEGEFLVLLGESGCGKSTLLNIIGGMDHPTSGSFECFGDEFASATQAQLTDYRRDNIGFIFQSYNLMPNLNAKQNLELIASLVPNPMSADEALDIVNLGTRKYNYPSQMSGGQQQRVSIARALMKRPRIILADEPTAALDYTTSIEVLEVMEKIVAEGTTMIMVTHNEEICRMADRVVRMRNGRMSEVTVNRHKAHATDLVW